MTKYLVHIIETAQDMLDVLEVRREVFVNEQKIPSKRERDGEDPVCTHVIVKVNGKAAGTLRFQWIGKNKIKVERIAIRKKYRGKGLGSKMVKLVENYAKKKKVKEIFLYGQAYAKDFYKKLGYSTDEKPHNDVGILHYKFVKKF